MAIGVCHEKAFFNGFSCNIGEYIAISYVLGNLFLALFHIVLFHLGKETIFYGQKINFNCDGKYRLGWQMSMSCRQSLPFGGKFCSKNRFYGLAKIGQIFKGIWRNSWRLGVKSVSVCWVLKTYVKISCWAQASTQAATHTRLLRLMRNAGLMY